MKTLTAAVVLGLSVGLPSIANAEPFNDRGALFLTTVTPSMGAPTAVDFQTNLTAYNDRGADFQRETTISHGPAVCPLDGVPASNGFHNRGRDFVVTADLERAGIEVHSRWAGDGHVTKC